MRSMREFYPDRPARLHEVLNDKVITWRTGWAHDWRGHAVVNGVDGSVSWDGLIFDGWEPVAI